MSTFKAAATTEGSHLTERSFRIGTASTSACSQVQNVLHDGGYTGKPELPPRDVVQGLLGRLKPAVAQVVTKNASFIRASLRRKYLKGPRAGLLPFQSAKGGGDLTGLSPGWKVLPPTLEEL